MGWLHAQVLVFVLVTCSSNLAFAAGVDLCKVDRSISKEPAWESERPLYCLLVISAERRVWFVVDGDDLFMDVNENGDLTDSGEKLSRLERSDELRGGGLPTIRWRIPDIQGADGEPIITNIKISPNIHSRPVEQGSYNVDFEIPVYGRVHTRSTFAATVADAPILHPTGPHRLSLSVRRDYLPAHRDVSNTFHVDGHKCVEGLGDGTSFALETVNLDCRVEFPLFDGGTRAKEFRLRNYVTGPYQTSSVTIPEGVNDAGRVKITLSRRPEATGPNVAPVVLETPVAKLRAVRRVNEPRQSLLQPSIASQQETLVQESSDQTEQRPTTAHVEKPDAKQILVTNHLLMGKIAHSEGDMDRALTWYHQAYHDATADDPRRVSARNLMGAWAGSLKQTLVHDQGVHTVAISVDGRKLVTGYYGSRAQIWDLETGMPQGEPLPHSGDIVSAQLSADARFVLIGDWGGAKVWDIATGKQRFPTLEHEVREDTVLGPILSPDGRAIVTRSPFTGIRIWDAKTGKPRGESLALGKFVSRMVFAPDSKRVAAMGGGVIQVCDVQTAKPVGEAFTDAIGLAFHPAGRVVAVSYRNGKIVLCDLESGKQIADLAHDKPLYSVQFDAEGKNLLCHDDEYAHLWIDALEEDRSRRELAHGRGLFTADFSPTANCVLTASPLKLRVWSLDGSAAGWERSVPSGVTRRNDYMNSVEFSPGGKSLLIRSENNTVEVVSVATGQLLVRESNVPPRATTYTSDGNSAILGSRDGWVRVRSVGASDERRLSKALPRSICSGSVIALSPDGKLIFVVGPDAKSHIYRTDTWEPVGKPLEGLYNDYKDSVAGAAFSPDNRVLLTSMSYRKEGTLFGKTHQVTFWDVATTSRISEPISDAGSGTVTFDPSGRYARVGASVIDVETRSILTFEPDRIPEGHQPVIQLLRHGDTSVPLLWDEDQEGPTTVNVPGKDVKMASLSPDGRRLLIVRKDAGTSWGIAQLHDATAGTPLGPAFQIAGFPGQRTDDGRYTLFGGNSSLRLWDTQLGRPCGEPLINEQSNVGSTFGPDGTVVATNWWFTAQLWDSATGLPLGPPMRMPSTFGAKPLFSPDGRRLYISSSGLEVWRVPRPSADDPERLRLSIEVRTGLEVDENSTIQKLSQAGWIERKRRLTLLGGPCDVRE